MSFTLSIFHPGKSRSKVSGVISNEQHLHNAATSVEHQERDHQPSEIDSSRTLPSVRGFKPFRPMPNTPASIQRNNPPELLPLNLNASFKSEELNVTRNTSMSSALPPVAALQSTRKVRSQEPRQGTFLDIIRGKKVSSSGQTRQGTKKNKKANDFERYKEMDLTDIEDVDPVDIDDKLVRCNTTKSEEYRLGYLRANTESPKLNGNPVKTMKEYLDRGVDKFRFSSFKPHNNGRTKDREDGQVEEEFVDEVMKLLDNEDHFNSTIKTPLFPGSMNAASRSISKKGD